MHITKQEVLNIGAVIESKTYKPVSHRRIMETIYEACDRRNLKIHCEKYSTNKKTSKVAGKMDIISGDDALNKSIAFINSDDKTTPITLVGGGSVIVCSNGMISGEIKTVRRHTGNIQNELSGVIEELFIDMNYEYEKLLKQKQRMIEYDFSFKETSELLGRMYMSDEELISANQLSLIRKIQKGDHESSNQFTDANLWTTYNHITEALKITRTENFIKAHKDVHSFFEREFELV